MDYMNLLKTKNPALYDKYQKELKDYEMRKAKVQLDANSSFQSAVGGKSLSYITSLLDNITREPGALADLTEEQIGDIYDGVNFLKSVSEGKKQGINYQTIQDLSQSIFDEMPLSIMEKYKPKLDNINEVIRSELTKQFEGDSDLMSELNFNTSARVEPSEETKAEVDIGEQPIETKPELSIEIPVVFTPLPIALIMYRVTEAPVDAAGLDTPLKVVAVPATADLAPGVSTFNAELRT